MKEFNSKYEITVTIMPKNTTNLTKESNNRKLTTSTDKIGTLVLQCNSKGHNDN